MSKKVKNSRQKISVGDTSDDEYNSNEVIDDGVDAAFANFNIGSHHNIEKYCNELGDNGNGSDLDVNDADFDSDDSSDNASGDVISKCPDDADSCYVLIDASSVNNSNKRMDSGTLNFDIDDADDRLMFNSAIPGTWLYNEIVSSSPFIAAQILTQHLNVSSIECAYLVAERNYANAFYVKHNNRKKY